MSKKILIVEDHADVRRLIRLTLEFEDYDIHEAGDAASAWTLARQVQPDLVLLDVLMPGGVDGLTLCRRLRDDAALCDMRIVLLTALDRHQHRAEARDAGADAYLVKPFSPLQLIDTVKGQWAAAPLAC